MSEESKTNLDEDISSDKIKDSENDDSIKEDIIFCSKCGLKNSSLSKYCSSCGNSLKSIEDNIKETANSIKSAINNSEPYKNLVGVNSDSSNTASWNNKDMVDFIQKNPEYYIPKFEKMQKYEKSTSWNWASFFLSSLWFLYRKMYTYGFGIMVLSFILSYIPFIGSILRLAIPILAGIFGNSIYLKHIEKNLSELNNLDEDVKHRVILSRGGVNLVLPIALCVVIFLLISIVILFGAVAMISYY